MAAVSTNYGTAGDSNLESSISASRSRGTKESSKSGSGSGSNSASRSRSLNRVQRKRAGTATRTGGRRMSRSSSTERLCREESHQGTLGDMNQGQKKRSPRAAVRAPIPRSMFPLHAPSKPTFVRSDKGKARARSPRSGDVHEEPDSIELMPQLHAQYGGQSEGPSSEDPDKMVIRKEVQYSVQYEYDEARRRGQGASKKSSTDAMAYV